MNLDLTDIDIKNIGSWPIKLKIVALGVIFAATIVLFFLFVIIPNYSRMQDAASQFQITKKNYRDSYHLANNLENYIEQKNKLQEEVELLMRKLPKASQIPSLLNDISHEADNAGLRYDEIKPLPEIKEEFYVEKPFQLAMIGRYHGLGKFVSGVASLSRIVTLHDFVIERMSPDTNQESVDYIRNFPYLKMTVLAKTYWENDTNKSSSSGGSNEK